MSVLVKGMEMPTSCGYCYMFSFLSDSCRITNHVTEEMNDKMFDKRFDDCPLVPVPKHGRLIDRDALMENAQDKGTHDIVTAWDIVAATTIIPASFENPAKSRDNHEIDEAEEGE